MQASLVKTLNISFTLERAAAYLRNTALETLRWSLTRSASKAGDEQKNHAKHSYHDFPVREKKTQTRLGNNEVKIWKRFRFSLFTQCVPQWSICWWPILDHIYMRKLFLACVQTTRSNLFSEYSFQTCSMAKFHLTNKWRIIRASTADSQNCVNKTLD